MNGYSPIYLGHETDKTRTIQNMKWIFLVRTQHKLRRGEIWGGTEIITLHLIRSTMKNPGLKGPMHSQAVWYHIFSYLIQHAHNAMAYWHDPSMS